MAYVCERCAEQYELLTTPFTCISSCEIHGPIKGQWGQTFTVWSPEIQRFICTEGPAPKVMLRNVVMGNLWALLTSCYCGVPHFIVPAKPWSDLPRT